ncbi:hypothetical protein DFH05DRAFT_1510161 [Lentinula detonsa]|uniref:Uncharacterized protein n=1 Tax=Lentinula detonsa TaxID=2804962 RepID=A0A9W8NSI8_9AGAR|nr:hypothetical protein DFH05DRAFT_1510161 [Lentinula detonsa]
MTAAARELNRELFSSQSTHCFLFFLTGVLLWLAETFCRQRHRCGFQRVRWGGVCPGRNPGDFQRLPRNSDTQKRTHSCDCSASTSSNSVCTDEESTMLRNKYLIDVNNDFIGEVEQKRTLVD